MKTKHMRPSHIARTFIAIRRTTKEQFNKNSLKRKIAKIDYMDKLVKDDSKKLSTGKVLT